MSHDPEIIDQIYESSLISELWPSVLAKLSGIAAARTGFLFVSNQDEHSWTSSTDGIAAIIDPLVKSGSVAQSDRFRRLLTTQHSGFIVDTDIYTKDELTKDPFYRDLLYPRGLGWAAAMAVSLPTGDRFTISLEKEYRLGPVERSAIRALDALRPHLARSALLRLACSWNGLISPARPCQTLDCLLSY